MFDVAKTFRPSLWKVVCALAVFVLFAPSMTIDTGVRCITAPCPSGKQVSIALAIISREHIFGTDPITALFWFGISYVFSACFLSFFSIIGEKRPLFRRS